VSQEAVGSLQAGIPLEEGLAKADTVLVLRQDEDTWLQIVLHQGWKRQIKRMCAAVGHPVITLHRSAIGFLTLDELPEGSYRCLTGEEVKCLLRLADQESF
jgi:23S rRNA pseudouridine2605 synthase